MAANGRWQHTCVLPHSMFESTSNVDVSTLHMRQGAVGCRRHVQMTCGQLPVHYFKASAAQPFLPCSYAPFPPFLDPAMSCHCVSAIRSSRQQVSDRTACDQPPEGSSEAQGAAATAAGSSGSNAAAAAAGGESNKRSRSFCVVGGGSVV